eukprot:TRINITY_DN11426_c0_g1_i8.p1 TRINITY_DN11426_c0_g1~~TRINITY_DN11426_c0_g1_i8.p1  ORF type:complete len:402 (+),score=46.29 TRINITY_DN11426_c0_g1_i8:74-1279(+)
MRPPRWLPFTLGSAALAAALFARHLPRRPPPAARLWSAEFSSVAEQEAGAAPTPSARPPQPPLAGPPLAARRKLLRGASAPRPGLQCQPREALLVSRRRHPDGYVLVLGANTGGHGEPELWWNETLFGRTYRKVLVEPVPPVFAELQRKMHAGGPPNTSLVQAAIGTRPGSTVTMHCWADVEQHPAFVGQLCSSDASRLVDGAWSLRYLRNLARIAERGSQRENRTAEVPPAARRLLAIGRNSRPAASPLRPHKIRSRPGADKAKQAAAWVQVSAARDRRLHMQKNPRVQYTVPVRTVEELMTSMRVPLGAVRYVQIDVEGADLAVLRSMPWGDASFQPSAVMWEQRHLDPLDRARAWALAQQHGYHVCPVCEELGGLEPGADPLGKCTLESATDVFALRE